MLSKKLFTYSFLLSLLCLNFSCKPTEENFYSVSFCPRITDNIWATNCYQTTYVDNGHTLHDYYILTDSFVKTNDFILSVSTGNKEMLTLIGDDHFIYFGETYHFLGTSIPSLETEIEMSFRKYMDKVAQQSSSKGTKFNVFGMEYRTDGVKSLRISALDSEISGIKPNESINNLFEIFTYAPNFIASAETKSILYGFSDTDKPTSIDEWVNLKPLAQPTLLLRFKNTVSVSSIKTRFKIDMITDNELQLSDTTYTITLTN